MKKASIYTLGCKVNQYESQAIKEQFEKKNYEIVKENEYADVYVINTCTVTNLSDRKSRQIIRRAKRMNPESIIVVTGCYAQINPDEVKEMAEVDAVVGINQKNNIVQYVEDLKEKEKTVDVKKLQEIKEFEDMSITQMNTRTRAYIKIQEGCNQFCAYCIIPYARCSIRSRKIKSIVEEAENIINNGIQEIVITGINAALYGADAKEEGTLLDVIEQINNIEGKFRIRLSSIEPAVITDEYMNQLMRYDKLCSHIHLSLQNGSQKILERMNRRYSVKEYEKIVRKLKEKRSDMNITTDIIVGFPGETEDDFLKTCRLVETIGFGKVHVFKYSKRKGTKAAEMKPQVDGITKSKRSSELIHVSETVASKFNEQFIGSMLEVLFEIKNQSTGYYEGLTDNYIKVYCKSDTNIENQFVKVMMTELFEDGLKGIIKNQ
ncbi:MAG: tRNA (N(6)-L-threonylcarbamoyladenosine(37)-C(2))-methylthiotransferase MtaB [Clostridia bacterium]|nr:tRNA (N(6)-L-threonylcarbamoyladenosine(37)-C(2))-methylthiotransferase MtaB [Clostridia bacterium]